MLTVPSIGVNSLTVTDWLNASRPFHVVEYYPVDVMSSFAKEIRSILVEDASPSEPETDRVTENSSVQVRSFDK
jgi:hypothetical protein